MARSFRARAHNNTANAEAYQNYIKGRYEEFRFTPEGMKNAIEHLHRAIALRSRSPQL